MPKIPLKFKILIFFFPPQNHNVWKWLKFLLQACSKPWFIWLKHASFPLWLDFFFFIKFSGSQKNNAKGNWGSKKKEPPPKTCLILVFFSFGSKIKEDDAWKSFFSHQRLIFHSPKEKFSSALENLLRELPQLANELHEVQSWRDLKMTSQFASEKVAAAFNQDRPKMWQHTYDLFNLLLAYIRFGRNRLSQRVLRSDLKIGMAVSLRKISFSKANWKQLKFIWNWLWMESRTTNIS